MADGDRGPLIRVPESWAGLMLWLTFLGLFIAFTLRFRSEDVLFITGITAFLYCLFSLLPK